MADFPESELTKLPTNGVGPLVLVRWVDTSGMTRWTNKEDLETCKAPEVETVGRLVKQTDALLKVAGSRDSHDNVNDTNVILMSNVLEIVYLRPYKPKARVTV